MYWQASMCVQMVKTGFFWCQTLQNSHKNALRSSSTECLCMWDWKASLLLNAGLALASSFLPPLFPTCGGGRENRKASWTLGREMWKGEILAPYVSPQISVLLPPPRPHQRFCVDPSGHKFMTPALLPYSHLAFLCMCIRIWWKFSGFEMGFLASCM